MALTAGEGEHGRGQRRDHEAEAESADRERDVGLPQRPDMEAELVGAPARHLEKRRRGQRDAKHRRHAAADATSEQAARHRADRHPDEELSEKQA